MEYNHIRDCWNALENAKSLSEMKELSDTFPRWSGDWSFDVIIINDVEMTVEVSNICENEETHYNFDIARCDKDADYYADFDDCELASSPLDIVTKECSTKLDKEKFEISIGNGKKIVVEKNDWNDEFPIEAIAYIQNDEGQILQDICLVRQHYEVKNGKAIVSDDVDVLVWAESDNEDYTDEFVINQVEDEDDD